MTALSTRSSATRHPKTRHSENVLEKFSEPREPRSSRSSHSKLLIVKFGGYSLATAKRVSLAAEAVSREYSKGTQMVVVVSAVGATTDRLSELVNGAAETDRDDILAMGERTSARIFAASLKSKGIQARYFDPSDKDWPIVTDDRFANANPLMAQSDGRIRRYVKPLLADGIVPVVCGFIGKTRDGRISTLGRGGSDTTALLMARSLDADEVVLVTNAPGIMTGDPKILKEAKPLKKIDMNSLVGIADSGTKFIHRKALRFKDPSINIRVVSHAAGTLQSQGTIITGGPLPELEVTVHNPDPVASLTLVGKGLSKNPELTRKVVEIVRSNLIAVSQDSNSAILYVSETPSLPGQITRLHRAIVGNPGGLAMAVRRRMALITVRGIGLEETPGVVAKISSILQANNINIFGILTITSSVIVVLEGRVRKLATRLVRNSLEAN